MYNVKFNSFREQLKIGLKNNTLISKTLFTLFTVLNISVSAIADSLTDMVYTDAFRGSLKWLEKVDFIGRWLNIIVSVFCFFGMFFIFLQIIITITYLAGRTFWDNVHEVKQAQGGGMVFGLGKDTATGWLSGDMGAGKTTGSDAVFQLIYVLAPDVKTKSDFADDNADGLGKDDSAITWFLKTSGVKLILMFFLAMGFNGTLMRAYANVVDAMGVAMERVVDYNLEEAMENLLSTGSNYKFSIGATGNHMDKTREKVANEMYKEVIKRTGTRDTATRMTVGKACEDKASSAFTDAAVKAHIKANSNMDVTDADLKYVKYEVITTPRSNSSNSKAIEVSFSQLGLTPENGDELYINVYFSLSRKADTDQYFNIKGKDKK